MGKELLIGRNSYHLLACILVFLLLVTIFAAIRLSEIERGKKKFYRLFLINFSTLIGLEGILFGLVYLAFSFILSSGPKVISAHELLIEMLKRTFCLW